MKSKLFLFISASIMSFGLTAQITMPQVSPEATLKQKVGLTDVEIIYSRPGAKGRVVFGEVVPFGEVWRTGANSSTKIKVSEKVTIGTLEVPAGQYALYTIPGKDEWTIIIHKFLENWGSGGYDQSQDLGRFTVKPTQTLDKYETFTIDFSELTTSSGNLNLIWENTKVTFPILAPSNEIVEKQITKTMEGPSANDYFQSARYYFDNNKNMDQALTYVNKAIEKRPEAFWYVHLQAKILLKLGKKKEALAAAEKSLAAAKESKDGDFGYILNNEKLIKEIKETK